MQKHRAKRSKNPVDMNGERERKKKRRDNGRKEERMMKKCVRLCGAARERGH